MLLRDYFNGTQLVKRRRTNQKPIGGSGVRIKKEKKIHRRVLTFSTKALNVVISRCCFEEDGKEISQNIKRTCRAIVFSHPTYCFVTLSLRKFLVVKERLPSTDVCLGVAA